MFQTLLSFSPRHSFSLILLIILLTVFIGRSNSFAGEPLPVLSLIEDDSYGIGPHPTDVVSGDFNNDGNEDLAVNATLNDIVGILLNKGDGSFQDMVSYWAGDHPLGLVTEDFDEDGNLDLAVSARDANLVVILKGFGDGTFGDSLVLPAGNFPGKLIADDCNKDGHIDLCNANAWSYNIGIYLGDGAGDFSGPSFYEIDGGPRSPEFGDFNEDGNLDVAVSLREAIDKLGIMFGDGTGAFGSTMILTIGEYPKESVVCDLNSDGHNDVAVACRNEDNVRIIFGDGTGSFSEPVAVGVGTGPRRLISGDVDGDGVTDLISSNYFGNSLSILIGDGVGGFPYRRDFEIGSSPKGLTLGDFDSDEKPDLAIAIWGENRLSIVLDAKDDVTPILISPADDTILTGDPLFLWKEVPGADAYQLVLYDSGDNLLWNKYLQGLPEILYEGPELLTPGESYRWSVREREQNDWNTLSPFFSFQKEPSGSVLPGPSLNFPPDSESIVLPELFSWSALNGAGKYEISVYDDPTTTILLYQGLSEENSLYIPDDLEGLTNLKDYYWQVRGIDSQGYAGDDSEIRQFNLTDQVPVPPAPVPVYPASIDTVREDSIAFVWNQTSYAAHFTLEFSRDSLFLPSSDMTWTIERITDSSYTAQLRDGATQMYWRVKGLNNAGESSWSDVTRFTYGSGTVPLINTVDIVEPANGSTIDLGSTYRPLGFITGSHSGIVEGLWLLNWAVIDSFSSSMDPINGVQIRGPVINTMETGADTLIFEVTSPDTAVSPPSVYEVVIPSSGEVSAIHMIASPFAIPADSQSQSTITAYMVDSEGRRVYTDYARLVVFVVIGEGFPVTSTSPLTDSGAVTIKVQATKTPDSDVLVFASSPGITNAYTYFLTYDADLEEYVARTLAHIERLESLPFDYYPDQFDTLTRGYDLTDIWDFLNEEILGIEEPSEESVESLKRLMLALRFVDMCYYYQHDPLFPEEDELPVYGTGFFLDQLAGPVSGGAIVANFLSFKADTILQGDGVSVEIQRVAQSIYRCSQYLFEGLYMPTLEWTLDTDVKELVFQTLFKSHSEADSLARMHEDPLSLFENYTIRLERQLELLDSYLGDTQYLIDDIASKAQQHMYSSNFEEAREGVDELLTQTRSITNTAMLESDRLDASNALLSSSKELSLLGESISQGLQKSRLIGQLRETAEYVSYPDRWSGAGETLPLAVRTLDELTNELLPNAILAAFGLERAPNASPRDWDLTLLGEEEITRMEDMLFLLSERSMEFESSTRGILSALSVDDSSYVASRLIELCEAGDQFLELMYILRGTFGSFSMSAAGGIGDFDQLYREMNNIYFNVSHGIALFELSLVHYLNNRSFEYATLVPIQSGNDVITGVNGAVEQFSRTIPSFFDLPALPSLVPSGLSFPDSVGPSRIFRVSAALLNVGSGEGSDISTILSFDGPFEFLSSDSIFVPSLSPGDTIYLSWQLRVKSPAHSELDRSLFPFSIDVRSSGSIAYPRFFLVKTYKKSYGANYAVIKKEPESDVRLKSLPKTFNLYQNSPNPFNPHTGITFDIPEGGPEKVTVKIYSVRGKLLTTLVDDVKPAGRYTTHWNGTDDRGRQLGTGIYFYVINAGPFKSVRKMLLRK